MTLHRFSGSRFLLCIIALVVVASGTILLAACDSTSSANAGVSTATAAPTQPTPTPTTAQQEPTPTPTPTVASNSNTFQVSIAGSFIFRPDTLVIPKGAMVVWTNLSNVGHTVTSDSNAFGSNGTLSQSQTFKMVFTTAGTFTYHCAIHPSMKGTIIVK